MNNRKKWSTEKLSTRVFYALTALAVVIFTLYWLVGYSRPFSDNPNFNAPLFTDAVIGLGYLLIALAMGTAIWAVLRALRIQGKGDSHDNNIPVRKISCSITAGTAMLLVITFAIGSSSEMVINGTRFADRFWLKSSDMLIYTSCVLLAAAIGSVIYGSTKYIRKK